MDVYRVKSVNVDNTVKYVAQWRKSFWPKWWPLWNSFQRACSMFGDTCTKHFDTITEAQDAIEKEIAKDKKKARFEADFKSEVVREWVYE